MQFPKPFQTADQAHEAAKTLGFQHYEVTHQQDVVRVPGPLGTETLQPVVHYFIVAR